ncbi:MAG: carbohydrate ABC transporter permease [Clostridia bacterium]|nr:carbohydrate ABC transporter permease [Clostridia bacterium]MBR4443748.1 carbohydrate ABC transporter permease [Clostridia bacterium]
MTSAKIPMKKKIRQTKADVVFDVFNTVFMVILMFVILYPLYFTVIASFSDPYAVVNGKVVFWPINPTLEPYANVFKENRIWIGYRNNLINVPLGTLWNLILTLPTAYVLSKKKLRGRGLFATYFLIPMYFGGGLVPTYMQIKSMGLVNTPYTLIVLSGLSIYNMIVSRVFFQTSIPEDIYESATIDGASDFRQFFQMALPLAKPIIAVMALFYAVGRWNDYFTALIFISDNNLQPLQIILRGILLLNQTALANLNTQNLGQDDIEYMLTLARQVYMAEGMKYSLIFISSAPLLIAYPFVQKYFVKGIMIGSLKG